MHKFYSPVLIPGSLAQLEGLDLIAPAEESPEHSQAVFKAVQLHYQAESVLRGGIIGDGRTKSSFCRWYPNLSHYFSNHDTQADPLSAAVARSIANSVQNVRVFIGGDDAWRSVNWVPSPVLEALNPTDEASAPSEVTEVAALRQEVDQLKKQVTVLTGLVQLRAEPAADPLAAAKSRGVSYMKTEFERADNLTLSAASEYSGRSDRMINLERNRGALYALILEGNTRGYRYPKWQFDVPSTRLRPVLDVLTPSSISCWSMHNFLTRPHAELDGRSPSAAIGDSDFPIERIVEVARHRVDQQQGAS